MRRIKVLTTVAGRIGDHDSPGIGAVLEVDDAVADAWADGDRAIEVDEGGNPVEDKPAPKRSRRPGGKKATATPKGQKATATPAGERATATPGGENAATPPAGDDEPPSDDEIAELLEENVEDVLEEVGEDRELAARVLEAERAGQDRTTLTGPLEQLASPDA